MITARTTGSVGRCGAAAVAFALQPGVRERGEDDVALPAGKRAAFEVIEAEFVLQFLILLLDRPALMRRAAPACAATRSAGRCDQIAPWSAASRRGRVRSSSQTSGASRRVAPVVRGRHAQRAQNRAAHGRLRAVAPRDEAPRAGGLRRGPGARLDGRRVGRAACGRERRTARAARGGTRDRRACRRKTVSVDETPKRIRQLRAMQRAPQRGALAELRIAEHRGDGESRSRGPAAAASAPAAISAGSARVARNPCARCARPGVSHDSGRYSAAPSIHARAPVHNATVTAIWQLAILPSAPQYCRATPTECGPCLGKLVPSRIRTPRAIGNRRRAAAATRARPTTAHR